jgi:hypothetical protein
MESLLYLEVRLDVPVSPVSLSWLTPRPELLQDGGALSDFLVEREGLESMVENLLYLDARLSNESPNSLTLFRLLSKLDSSFSSLNIEFALNLLP